MILEFASTIIPTSALIIPLFSNARISSYYSTLSFSTHFRYTKRFPIQNLKSKHTITFLDELHTIANIVQAQHLIHNWCRVNVVLGPPQYQIFANQVANLEFEVAGELFGVFLITLIMSEIVLVDL